VELQAEGSEPEQCNNQPDQESYLYQSAFNEWTGYLSLDTNSRDGFCKERFMLTTDLPARPVCNNGEIEIGEKCDDGAGNGDGEEYYCTTSCEVNEDFNPPNCGNGDDSDPHETCDDGNRRDGDGCSSKCQKQVIGKSTFPWSVSLHPEDVYEYAENFSKPHLSTALDEIKALGAEFVRFDVPWDDIQPTRAMGELNDWCYIKDSKSDCQLKGKAGLNFFRDQWIPALEARGLKPIMVLYRIPDWAKSDYQWEEDKYWLEWKQYCKKVAYHLRDKVFYYQMSNEANFDLVDPIMWFDDPNQFVYCEAGIAEAEGERGTRYKTMINVYSSDTYAPNWRSDLEDWMGTEATRSSIDIIGIDHYPSTWTFSSADDWQALDDLLIYMTRYGKQGAIFETGFSSFFEWVNHSEEDQKIWINYALPIIKEKVKGRTDFLLANFYELYDSAALMPLPQEGFFGILNDTGNHKAGYDSLLYQIVGKPLAGSSSAMTVEDCPDYDDQNDDDGDGVKNVCDTDDDNDGVIDSADRFPVDASETVDTDNDGVGDNADLDDDGDEMPDAWEITYGLNPVNAGDRNADADGDGFNNRTEYGRGTDPIDFCSPGVIESFCYSFWADEDPGQCGGEVGERCVPVGEWSPTMEIMTDERAGGCLQRFSIRSRCVGLDARICVDFQGTPGVAGQCNNIGNHCAGINEWTDPFRMDMDGRYGFCTQQFSITSSGAYRLELEFGVTSGGDASQCINTGHSTARTTGASTDVVGLDVDGRAGGCTERLRLLHGLGVVAF